MTDSDLLSISQIEVHLGVSRWTVTRLLDSGALESVRTPTGRRVQPAAYRAWIARQAVAATPEDGDMPSEIPPLHQFEMVAETYSLSLRMLKDRARAGAFEHTRIGSGWYFTPAQLTSFLAAHTKAAAPAADDFAGARGRLSRRTSRRSATRAAA